MAWMAAHLFVRCDDSARVGRAVEALLADAAHRADLGGIADPPGAVALCPPVEGWVAVTGAGAWLDDLLWAARELSSRCGSLALSCEVFGNCYRARLAEHQDGATGQLLCTPEALWATTVEPAQMPLYDDVEQLAFRWLGERSVPPALAAVGTLPLGSGASRQAGQGTRLLPTPEGIERGGFELELPTFSGDDAPVLPARMGEDIGLVIFEDRYVEGDPGGASVDRLIAIEEEFGARARRARGGVEVSVTFTYYAGTRQDKLDALLRARDRPTLPSEQRYRPPWWAFWRHFGRMR